MYKLEGKVALVTGAGGERGIGRAIAVRLAREGADVVINDIQMRPSTGEWGGMEAVVAEIQTMGHRSLGLVADVGDSAQVQTMVDQTIEQMGRIDILVNNAGARAGMDRVPVVDLEEADWDRVQRINSKGTFLCSRAVARAMLAHHWKGKIINLSSISGKVGRAKFAAYCASKFAIIGFTQSLAQELAPHGILVNAICPSLIATERIDHMAEALSTATALTPEAQRARLVESAAMNSPLGRMATVEDIAATAAFLSSSESNYLTGLAINVAGGMQMD